MVSGTLNISGGSLFFELSPGQLSIIQFKENDMLGTGIKIENINHDDIENIIGILQEISYSI